MSNQGESSTEDDLLVSPSTPTNISATSQSPSLVEPVSETLHGTQPATDDELSGGGEVEAGTPVEFDPKYRESFTGLLFIGKVTKEFKWLGHTFILKSPTVGELLEAGQLHKAYVNTVSDIKAWQSIIVAASIQSIDGRPLTVPITNEVSALEAKFNYINVHWYPWTLDVLYEQYILLDKEVADVIEALGKV
jgi:hypothetical protein